MEGGVLGLVGGIPCFQLLGRHALHVAPRGFVLTLLGSLLVEFGREIDEEVVVQIHVPIDLQLLVAGGRGVVLPLVEERGRLGDLDVVVKAQMARGGHPIPVWRLVLNHHHEGFVRLALLCQPVDGEVGHDIRAMAVDASFAVCEDHVGVVVKPLTRQHGPVVESLRLALEVALAVDGGLVAGFLEKLGKDLLIPIEGIAVVHEAVLVAVLAAHDDGAARAADGVRAKASLKGHAVFGELVDFRRGIHGFQPAIVGTNRVRCVIVGKNEDNVGSIISLGGDREDQGKGQES